MRGWAIGILMLVLGAGVWMLAPWSDQPPELGDAGEGPAAERRETGNPADMAESMERARQSDPKNRANETAKRFTVPVELIAFVVDQSGREGKRLDGFKFRVTDAKGRPIAKAEAADSGHELSLGVGSYVVHVAMAERVAPAPASVTITEESEPLTLRFPFRDVEALLLLEVLDQTTKGRIEEYRVTVETHVPREAEPRLRFVPQPDSNPLSIPAARGQKLVVKVEAKGFAPGKPLTVEFDGSLDRIERQLFLAPAMKFTGVEFQVTDAGGTPIPRASVLVETKQRDGSFQKLWRRRNEDPNGVYKLPNLAPGSYRFEVRSVDEAGIPTLHLAHTYEVQLTGNEHIREVIVLGSGGAIELRLTDARGNRIGKGVSIELTHPDGKVRESLWRPVVDGKPDPKAGLSADHLALDAHARLDQCVPEGLYTIKLRWEKGPLVEEKILVRARDVFALSRQLSK